MRRTRVYSFAMFSKERSALADRTPFSAMRCATLLMALLRTVSLAMISVSVGSTVVGRLSVTAGRNSGGGGLAGGEGLWVLGGSFRLGGGRAGGSLYLCT